MTDGADSASATDEPAATSASGPSAAADEESTGAVSEGAGVGPLIVAEQLGLRTRRGWVYRDVDLAVPAGSVTALAGPSGSGRSMLLLTIAGRARPTGGRLVVAGAEDRARIRRSVAVGRVTAAVELEPELSVVDHVREARLLNGGDFDYVWARDLLGLTADPTLLVADLPTDESVLLSVALALAARPAAIVVDDVDIAASSAQQVRMWRAFRDVPVAVIASTVDGMLAGEAGAAVVTMGGGPR